MITQLWWNLYTDGAELTWLFSTTNYRTPASQTLYLWLGHAIDLTGHSERSALLDPNPRQGNNDPGGHYSARRLAKPRSRPQSPPLQTCERPRAHHGRCVHGGLQVKWQVARGHVAAEWTLGQDQIVAEVGGQGGRHFEQGYAAARVVVGVAAAGRGQRLQVLVPGQLVDREYF